MEATRSATVGSDACAARSSRPTFRYAELEWAIPPSIRRTVVARLYDRGADEEQVGLVLGIREQSAVHEQFPRARPSITSLVQQLV